MKKSLALLITLVLCMSMFAGVSVNAFSDVEDGHRHSDAITYLTEKEVINGYEDGSFKPENTITRAEFLKMLMEFLGFGNIYEGSDVKTGFTDVDGKTMTVTSKNDEGKEETKTTNTNQHWAAAYIKAAVDKDVVNGYGDGTFRPDIPVKYEEAIKMIVCCLGRGKHAVARAEKVGIPLWPDGYISIGNDLTMSKNTEYAIGENATRSNVAQMLYNVKNVEIISTTPSTGGSSGGSSGGGGGGSISFGGSSGSGGGGNSGGSIQESTTVVAGLVTYGQVVGVVKDAGGAKKTLLIDDNVVIGGEAVTTVGNNYMIVKLEVPVEGETYAQFYTNGNDFSSYLGQRTKVKYRYNPDGGRSGRYEIQSVESSETEYKRIPSTNIKRTDTISKSASSTIQNYLCWTDGDRDYDEPLYTKDLNSLKIIYNNRIVDTEATPITLNDLMPENGSVVLVNANEDSTIDLIWVESYETYIVGTRNFNSTPKSISDKFRTQDDGVTPVTLTLNDAVNSGVNLYIRRGDEEKEVTDIATNDILTVAQSKCGQDIDISIDRVSSATGVFKTHKVDSAGRNIIELANGTAYVTNDYFEENVRSTLEYEMGDSLTLYLDKQNEVLWASVAAVSYSTGYLVRAIYAEATGKLSLEILTSSGSIQTFTLDDTRTRFITKAHTFLDENGVTPDSMTNPNGYLYKNLNEDMIYQAILENANTINTNKASGYITNATTSQPIMYTVSSGSTLSHLITLEPDVANRFEGTTLQYRKLGTGEHNFTNENGSFSAGSSALFIFVPNDRQSNATAYKIGTASSAAISKKLVGYMNYNVEPYYTTNTSGQRTRSVFVVYNENIDRVPTYRTENMIVSYVGGTYTGGTTKYTIKGYVASNTSTKEYTTNYESVVNQAYVLDENFERTGERRAVEVGDVIRVGYFPSGTSIASIDIILDASVVQKSTAPKAMAVKKNSELYDLSTSEPEDYAVYYFARMGEVINIDPAEVKEWCDIKISDTFTSRVTIGSTFSSRQILMYDHTATDDLTTDDKDERLKVVTLGNLWGGEILYVWQGENLAFKQIYAVRYPTVQSEPESEPETEPTTEP